MPERKDKLLEALQQHIPNYQTEGWTPELIERNVRDVLRSGDNERISNFLNKAKTNIPNYRDNPEWDGDLIIRNIKDVLGEEVDRVEEDRESFFRRIVNTARDVVSTIGAGAGARAGVTALTPETTGREQEELQEEFQAPEPDAVLGSFIGLTWNVPARAVTDAVTSIQRGTEQIGVSPADLRDDEVVWEPAQEVKNIFGGVAETMLGSIGLLAKDTGEFERVEPTFEHPGSLLDEMGIPAYRLPERTVTDWLDAAVIASSSQPPNVQAAVRLARIVTPFISSSDPEAPPEDREISTNDFLGWLTMLAIPDYIISGLMSVNRIGGRAAQTTLAKSPEAYQGGARALQRGMKALEEGGNPAVAADELHKAILESPFISPQAKQNLRYNVNEFKQGIITGEVPIIGQKAPKLKATIIDPNRRIITAADDPRAIVPIPVEHPGMIGIRPTRQLTPDDNELLQRVAVYGLPESTKTNDIVPRLGGLNAETRLGRVGGLTDEQLTLVALERGVFDFAPVSERTGVDNIRGVLNVQQVRRDELRRALPQFGSVDDVVTHSNKVLKGESVPVLQGQSKILAREIANTNLPVGERVNKTVQMQRIEDALDKIHTDRQFRIVDYENPLRALTRVEETRWKDAIARGAPQEEIQRHERVLDELITGYRQIYGDAPERVINLTPDVRHVRLTDTAKADIARQTTPRSQRYRDDFDKLRAIADGTGVIRAVGDKRHNRIFQDMINKGYARIENDFGDVSTLAFTDRGREAWNELVNLQLRYGVELDNVKLPAVDNFISSKRNAENYLSGLTAHQQLERAGRIAAERARIQPMASVGVFAGFEVDEDGEFTGEFNPWVAAGAVTAGLVFGMAMNKSPNARNFFKKAASDVNFSKRLNSSLEYAGRLYRGKELGALKEFGKLSDAQKTTVRSSGIGWTRKELDELIKTGNVPETIFEQMPAKNIPRGEYIKKMHTNNSTPEEATNYLYETFLTPASDNMVDVSSTAFLKTGNIADYYAHLQKPSVPTEFADYIVGGMAKNYYARSYDMRGNFSLMDGGAINGVMRRHIYSSQNQVEMAADVWTNQVLADRVYSNADRLGVRKGSTDARLLTQVGEKISSEDATLPVAQLLQRQDISDLVKGSQNKKGVVELATIYRKLYDELLDEQNFVRGILEHRAIPKQAEYMPHVQVASMMDIVAPHRKMEALDFIKPGKAFNPRALEREFGIKWAKREQDGIKLLEKYIEGSARREVFLNPFIQQLRRYEDALREPWRLVRTPLSRVPDDYALPRGLALDAQGLHATRKLSNFEWDTAIKGAPDELKPTLRALRESIDNTPVYDKPAKAINEWVGQVYVGNMPAGLEATTWLPPKMRSALIRGSNAFKGFMSRTVFPLNITWNSTIQTSSAVFTPMHAGVRNTIRGIHRYATNKQFRELMPKLYANHVKIYRRGTAQFQDAGTYAETLRKHHRAGFEKLGDALSYATTTIEKNLSLWSGAAKWVQLERMGFRGRALFDAASDGIAATQSMYDRANIPPVLRDRILTGMEMFQTFLYTAMNNMIREHRLVGIRDRKLKYFLTGFAGMMATNYMVSNLTGRSPYEFPWTFLPFSNLARTVIPIEKVLSRQPELSRVARDVGLIHDFPTRGLPTPVGVFEDGAKGIRDLWANGDHRAMTRWGVRYAPGMFGVGGGIQYERIYRTLDALAEGGDILDSRGHPRYSFDVSDPSEVLRAFAGGPTRTRAYLQWRKDHEFGTYMERAMWRLHNTLTEGAPEPSLYQPGVQTPLERGVRPERERTRDDRERPQRQERERTR